MSEIQAKGISGRLTLAARDGTVQLLEHSEWYTWRADDVAAVVAEAIRQREEIERKKWTREFIVDGWRFVVMREDDGSFHVGSLDDGRSWAASFAMRVLAAYRELVKENKSNGQNETGS